jgi:[ribosomal protein S5]-alanine N-acetyltransferase
MVVSHQPSAPDMAKKPIPHPTLLTSRLRLRQFRVEDIDAMHECFGDPDVMRYWNRPVHTKRIETERAVRNYIDCTPSYYRFWAVADAGTDRCIGLVSYYDGHIRSKRGLGNARPLLRRTPPAPRAGVDPS